MPDIIEPRVLKGFRDYLPEAEIERSGLVERLEASFRSFGFVPIDTPAMEYAEILLGKGGGETDKQVYRFKDHGGRDVALRFDLTVPFARFMAEHADELYLPFRRYHVAKVWRGENTQRGRYREFMQCDFDIVGVDSAEADADIVLLIDHALSALDVGGFTIRVNHRGIFNRFLEKCGVGGKAASVQRLVDKLEKIGRDELRERLASEVGASVADRVLEFTRCGGDSASSIDRLEEMAGGPGPDSERLRAVLASASVAGAKGRVVVDPSITRGLDYYTGVVFETLLEGLPSIGSVCSGGRYDELASLYTTKKLPGVGASIGLDRLIAALETLGLAGRRKGYTEVLVLDLEEGFGPRYQALARVFRLAGIACEVYPERRKLAQQFAYAERKGIAFALLLGSAEADKGVVAVKDLKARQTVEVDSPDAAVAFVRERLAAR